MAISMDEIYTQEVNRRAVPFRSLDDLDTLIDELRDKKVVMLGEASHGTHEFYEWRSEITKRLIERHNFNFVAVEGDWPSCSELNQYIQSRRGKDIYAALSAFKRWPTWMWANLEVGHFASWMRKQNASVGFHGLDVYSLFESIDVATRQLEKIDPKLAKHIRGNYECFDPFLSDEKAYARSTLQFPEGCQDEVIDSLQTMLKKRIEHSKVADEILFDAIQNARVVQNAERYYRALIQADEESWNVRDRHMLEVLDSLFQHYGPNSKGIVWEHNTHIGDYRATDMVDEGHINVGGLARERYGEDAVALVGFGTYQGTVIASHAWEGPTQVLPVPPARAGSIEFACHEVALKKNVSQFFMLLDPMEMGPLSEMKGHRAIGVVYDPKRERWGNYVPTALPRRYDAFIFIDETSALEPIMIPFKRELIPETWPAGR